MHMATIASFYAIRDSSVIAKIVPSKRVKDEMFSGNPLPARPFVHHVSRGRAIVLAAFADVHACPCPIAVIHYSRVSRYGVLSSYFNCRTDPPVAVKKYNLFHYSVKLVMLFQTDSNVWYGHCYILHMTTIASFYAIGESSVITKLIPSKRAKDEMFSGNPWTRLFVHHISRGKATELYSGMMYCVPEVCSCDTSVS